MSGRWDLTGELKCPRATLGDIKQLSDFIKVTELDVKKRVNLIVYKSYLS